MQHYLINSTICSFVLWLAYKLLLENTSWHQFKRWFLIGSIMLSLIIPLIVTSTQTVIIQALPIIDDVAVNQVSSDLNTSDTLTAASTTTTFLDDFTITDLLVLIYGIGVIFMLIRFVINLIKLLPSSKENTTPFLSYSLISRNKVSIPYSFYKYIYIDSSKEASNINQAVLNHEMAHLDQRHFINNLFLELLLIVLWFQPVVYLFKYSIKLNHEFLADAAILKTGIDRAVYQKTLLSFSSRKAALPLANTFNFPLIKKRFEIMSISTSKNKFIKRVLLIIPMLVLLVISCGKSNINRIIDHSNYTDDTDTLYGIDINGDEPTGTVTYNGIEYKYVVEDDYTARLFFMDGEEVDIEKISSL